MLGDRSCHEPSREDVPQADADIRPKDEGMGRREADRGRVTGATEFTTKFTLASSSTSEIVQETALI